MQFTIPGYPKESILVWLFLSQNNGLASAATLTLSYPTSMPTNAVLAPPNFVSVGFETGFFDNYANDFSENLVSSLAKRMRVPLIIRVGGTSGDRIRYDPDLPVAKKCIDGECPDGSSSSFVLGPKYFDKFKRFPNAQFTFQASLGKEGQANPEVSLPCVRQAWNAIGADRVAGIALGNEPSFFYDTENQYVNGAMNIQNAIVDALALKGDQAKLFEIADTLSNAAQTHRPYAVKEIFQAGYKDKHVKFAAEHYYQITGTDHPWDVAQLQAELMNHTAIVAKLKQHLESINFVKNKHSSVRYILSETGSALNTPLKWSAGFGATLWSVDFQIAAMTHNVKRVVDSGRPAAKHSSWVPDDSVADGDGPQVRALFMANVFVADFVGSESKSAILEANMNQDLLSGYVMYNAETGKRERLALLNLRAWDATTDAERGRQAFSVPVGNASSVKIRTLHADRGVFATGFDIGGTRNNVTWAGEQWSYLVDKGKGHFPARQPEEETITAENGRAVVKVPQSEAVIMSFT
ncbi:glycoside hydrolase family 79 protein [Zopfia rhizophila CBS 207.26]|uniref:Glycoside hydrolase family 79 protein n=1 Tax=Zopfia rhizophila CBS 207.26 TaxID=1314779 RepID=A0A6A6DZT8_9PEZI|nr:glycoside hydrolase family 79 protein [Zopfia rhizophila CBS 207.26]